MLKWHCTGLLFITVLRAVKAADDAGSLLYIAQSHANSSFGQCCQSFATFCNPSCCITPNTVLLLQGLPLLVFANKMDLPESLQPVDIANQLQLTQLVDRAFHITGCSALQNEGVQQGMKWLSRQLQSA